MPLWLVNPGGRGKRDARGRFVKRKRAAAKKKRPAARKSRKRSTRRRKATQTQGESMAAKRARNGRFVKGGGRRRRRAASSAPKRRRRRRSTAVSARRRSAPARRRRRYRRNPGFSLRSPLRGLMEGTRGAVGVVVGKAAARAVPQQLGLPSSGPLGIATMLGVALALGMVADKVSKKDAPFIMAGALSAPIEGLIRDLNVPILSPALSAYPRFPAGQPNIIGSGTTTGRARSGLAAYAGAMEMPSA